MTITPELINAEVQVFTIIFGILLLALMPWNWILRNIVFKFLDWIGSFVGSPDGLEP